MATNRRAAAAVAAALLLGLFAARADVAVPPLQARVTDLTGTLDAGQRTALEARLAEFEKRKGSQIAVLLVPTTQPETIEQYSIRVVDQWKLGRKGVDDGALLLVAKNDRAVRIEVGRGLEGPLPDAIASRIIREHITPRFREGDFSGGINAGVDRIIAVIDGEPLPAPATSSPRGDSGLSWTELMMFALVAGSFGNMILRAMLGRFGAAALIGGVVGLVIWIFYATLVFSILGGVLMFVFALLFGAGGGGGRWSRGGWGGGGGGWSSGGGGFSGGGGGFSGGGASGRW